MPSTFREMLRDLRNRAGVTQEELAERSGVSVRTIRGLERGERTNPRADTVKQLVDALGLSADEQNAFFALAAGQERAETPSGAAGRRPRQPDHLTLAADELAMGVGIRLRRAYEHQQMHDPFPLPVRWRQVFGKLSDHVDNIHALSGGERADRIDLVGGFSQIAEIYRRLPSGRLVVLGDAGSGKTMLATRLTLDLLGDREQAQPVPVTVNVASWDPARTRFRDWLTGLLIRDHPDLARITAGGLTLSAALVETDMILPVLDGFDEIAPNLRGAAMQALNRATLPVVLTSRPAEYETTVTVTDVLTAAAVVRIDTLTASDVTHYLPRATRSTVDSASGGAPETVWHPVISQLTANNPGRGARNVAAALGTPLMVSLARSIYSDTPGRDPAVLLDIDQFPSAADIEDHLLGSYAPTMYRDQPAAGTNAHGWREDQVLRWLNYLARNGITQKESGIAWWGIGTSVPVVARAAVVGLVSAFTIMLVYLVVGTPLFLILYGGSFASALRLQLVNGFLNGAVAGLVLALGYGFVRRFRVLTPVPAAIRVRLGQGRPRGAIPLAQVRVRILIGLVCGLVFGVVAGTVSAVIFRTGVSTGVTFSVVFGVVFALAAGAAAGLVSWFESPADADSAASPVDSLKANREAVLTQILLGGFVFGLVTGLGAYAAGDITFTAVRQAVPELVDDTSLSFVAYAFGTGIMNWIFGAFVYAVVLTSWGHWVIQARLWLPLTGRLPWRLLTFMQDAYERGVLRQSGPVWEFRHDRLQQHHAEHRR